MFSTKFLLKNYKIYHTPTPVFIRKGKNEAVRSEMFEDIIAFNKMLDNKFEKGMTEVYIYSMFNTETSIHMEGTTEFSEKTIRKYDPTAPNNEGDPILFVRFRIFYD